MKISCQNECFIDFKHTISIAIAVLVFILFSNTSLLANSSSEDLSLNPIMLGTLLISAKRVGSEGEDIAENVTVYTKEEIERSSANNLGEVLKYIPGVDVSVTNQFGQATSLSIHGSNSRQVLIMIDGIPFNTQLSGQADPSIIPVENIERIEILKGASSSVWGSSLGGVINVITKDAGDSAIPKGKFKTTFAGFSTTKNSLELAGKVSEVGYLVSGSYLETDGTKSRSDVQEEKIFAKVSVPISDALKIISSFGYTGANVHDGVNSDGTWDSMPYIARYGNVKMDLNKDDLKLSIAYKYNDQDVVSDNYDALTNAQNSSSINNNIFQGISINGSLNLREEDLFVFGSDFDWHRFKSSNYLDTGKSISMQSPYANYTLKLNDWDFIPGVRFDNNQQFGSQTSPSLGIIYHFKDSNKSLVRAKISRAFSAPPLMWIYNNLPPYVNPNPDLKAEKALVYEVGFETELFSIARIKLDIYRSDVKDAIVYNDSGSMMDNLRKLRRQGAELSLNYKVNDELTIYGSGAFNDVENRETKQTVRDSGIARQSFILGSKYQNDKGFGFDLYGYYNRWSSDPDQANDRKFMFDAKFRQKFKDVKENIDLELFLNIYNLANSKYWSDPTYPLPKRYFEGGVTLYF